MRFGTTPGRGAEPITKWKVLEKSSNVSLKILNGSEQSADQKNSHALTAGRAARTRLSAGRYVRSNWYPKHLALSL
jgi:hypothetical protein